MWQKIILRLIDLSLNFESVFRLCSKEMWEKQVKLSKKMKIAELHPEVV